MVGRMIGNVELTYCKEPKIECREEPEGRGGAVFKC